MSVLLYGPGSETLAVVVLNTAELGQVGNTAALSLLLTAILLVPASLSWWAIRRLDRRPGGPCPLKCCGFAGCLCRTATHRPSTTYT